MKHSIEYRLGDDSQHEKLFVELWALPAGDLGPVDVSGFKHSSRELFAVIQNESAQPEVVIFPRRNSEPWSFGLSELKSILEIGFQRLSGT